MSRRSRAMCPLFMRRCRRLRARFLPLQLPLILLVFFTVQTLAASFAFPTSLPFPSLFPGSNSRRPPPAAPGFADRSKYVGLDRVPGSAIAVADLNHDRFPDLVLLDANTLNGLSVALWDQQRYRFRRAGPRIILGKDVDSERGPTIAEEVLLADFSASGSVDLLVVGEGKGVLLFGVPGSPGQFNTSNLTYLKGQVMSIMDVGRDLAPDIFTYREDGTRGFYVNDGRGNFRYMAWKKAPKDCVLSKYNPPAFVDMDGDCLPDFVVPSSCGIEIYTNVTNLWSKGKEDARVFGSGIFNPSNGDGPISLTDFDASGSIDILVPNFHRKDILVYASNRTLSGRSKLCTADPYFNFTRVIGMARGVGRKKPYLGSLLFSKVHIPSQLRAGDFNMDGFPDLLYVNSMSRPTILRNKNNWGVEADNSKDHFEFLGDKDVRSFKSAAKGAAVVAATFWDTGESGRQDILLVDKSNSTRLITNGYGKSGDGMFFKGTFLQGSSVDGSSVRSFDPAPGATFEVAYATRDSPTRRVRVCGQCPTSGWTLLPCNCVFGLGSISNYIEEVAVGAGRATGSWTNLMPNSMAIVWADEGTTSDGWLIKFFAQARSAQILGVVSILLAVMLPLGGVILYLQNLERKQERKEEDERAPLFHFGA